jgi:hypothetical protein
LDNQGCDKLETSLSGSDISPKSAKKALAAEMKKLRLEVNRTTLCQLVEERKVDVDKIRMPSFAAFRERLEEVVREIG